MGLIPIHLQPTTNTHAPGTLLLPRVDTRGLFVKFEYGSYYHNTVDWYTKSWSTVLFDGEMPVIFITSVKAAYMQAYSGIVLWKGDLYAVSLEDFYAVEA